MTEKTITLNKGAIRYIQKNADAKQVLMAIYNEGRPLSAAELNAQVELVETGIITPLLNRLNNYGVIYKTATRPTLWSINQSLVLEKVIG